jgi:hypothetical protein
MKVDDDYWSVQHFGIRLQKRGKDSNEGIEEQENRSVWYHSTSTTKRSTAYGRHASSHKTQTRCDETAIQSEADIRIEVKSDLKGLLSFAPPSPPSTGDDSTMPRRRENGGK